MNSDVARKKKEDTVKSVGIRLHKDGRRYIFRNDDRPILIRGDEWERVSCWVGAKKNGTKLEVLRHKTDNYFIVHYWDKMNHTAHPRGGKLEMKDTEWSTVVATIKQIGEEAGLSKVEVQEVIDDLPPEDCPPPAYSEPDGTGRPSENAQD